MRWVLSSRSGFSLVEVVIVIVLIGVVVTLGIPNYKKFVHKARKSEAKEALAGLYTVEVGFFNEHNAYGNNIEKVGFRMDAQNLMYSVGFPAGGNCSNDTNKKPLITTNAGNLLNFALPSYYADPYVTVIASPNASSCKDGTVNDEGTTFNATATADLARTLASPIPLAQMDVWEIDNDRNLKNSQDGSK